MENLKSNLQDFINARLDEIYLDLKKDCREYKSNKDFTRTNVEKFEEIIDKLSKEERDFIKEYGKNELSAIAQEQTYTYYRAFKDCINLLKIFEII